MADMHERARGGVDGMVEVDSELCIGSGMCIVFAPGTFAHDDHAKVVVVDTSADELDVIRSAVEACPTNALTLLPDERGE